MLGNIIYNIIITPVYYLVELVFFIMYRVFSNVGLAIVGVSLAVNVLCFPLYKRADAVQDAERDKQKHMKPWIEHIRNNFTGDERFMMTQAYYREQRYTTLSSVKGMVTLVLQIPFLLAAYRYLSELVLLQGTSFLFLNDLSEPDGLIKLGKVSVNLLPILMTVINFASSYIYTKGISTIKENMQLYIVALVFLVFLYNCPSGLVMYWTLNNLFSFGKNLFMKYIKNPGRVICIIISALGWAMILFFFASGGTRKFNFEIGSEVIAWSHIAMALFMFAVMQIPVSVMTVKYFKIKKGMCNERSNIASKWNIDRIAGIDNDVKSHTGADNGRLWAISGFVMVSILGLLVPLSVISASPVEFVTAGNFVSPLRYSLSSASISFGFVFFWGGIIYFLLRDKWKGFYAEIYSVLAVIALADHMLFVDDFGVLSTDFRFSSEVRFSFLAVIINAIIIVGIIVLIVLLRRKAMQLLKGCMTVILLGCFALSALDAHKVNKKLEEVGYAQTSFAQINGRNDRSDISGESTEGNNRTNKLPVASASAKKTAGVEGEPFIHLDKRGRNVIVLMLDRAVGGYVPFIMQEKPELVEQFDGFTYFHNTVSFGGHTRFGAPALFGGYEYMPSELNSRKDELMVEKHDESLKVMPVLFYEAGFDTTVTDPPYANYQEIGDLTIYDDYPGMRTYTTINGEYLNLLEDKDITTLINRSRERRFFFYSIYRAMPLAVRKIVYDRGNYLSAEDIPVDFLNNYVLMKRLDQVTVIEDDATDHFLMMTSELAHDSAKLQLPDYTFSRYVDNSNYSSYREDGNGNVINADNRGNYYYHINMASFLCLGEWFDYLKQQGVYDNTRIIIVSDHGTDEGQFDNMIYENGFDLENFMPLLMFKDFDSTGYSVNEDFMTNADVPALALSGIIEHPVNPFTGNYLDLEGKIKSEGNLQITSCSDTSINREITVFDTEDSDWYSVHDNIYDLNNWDCLGPYNAADEE
ncbi:MAG: membrane protein insertase YidC [Lachnospiraceae bacterium]|nr:membrane protein insertase YidC [Lachnospiraceae bacterium]